MTSLRADQFRDEISIEAYDILFTRYLTLAALVVLIFEAARKLTEDFVFVWPAKSAVSKSLYVLNRIIVLVGALAGNYALGGLQDDISKATCMSLHLYDKLHLGYFVYWHCRRSKIAMWWMIGSFIATYTVAVACMTSAIVTHNQRIEFNQALKICSLNPGPKIVAGVYASGLGFEIIMFASAFVNVLAKPRDSRTSLTKALIRDGTYYFIAVSALRLTNVLVVLAGRPTLYYSTVFFVWAMITLLVNRLILNQYRARLAFDFRFARELADMGIDDRVYEPEYDSHELGVVSPPRHTVVF
ncbi:hypothetical protein AURDEDRAFT_161131 [Auricularia subglabra TFB-10046 SS5]|nr:hypothetical protein AURDEDRAFT_161131 [Auricularia subglabra TFB-10046 SS5]